MRSTPYILILLTLAGVVASQALGQSDEVLGRSRDGMVTTSSALIAVPRQEFTSKLLPLFSWQDTNHLAFEAGIILNLPPTNVSSTSVRIALERVYDSAVKRKWHNYLLNQMLEDAGLRNAKPPLEALSGLAHLVANSELARRTLVYGQSALTDEAYLEGWRKFYSQHRPKVTKEQVEQVLPKHLRGRQQWLNSKSLIIEKALRSFYEPDHASVSNHVWWEARAALVSQTLRGMDSAPPQDVVDRFMDQFIELHAPRFTCQSLITTNNQRAAEWLLAARQTIVTNAAQASLFEMLGLKESALIPTGRHVTSRAKLEEALGKEFDSKVLPRAFSIELPQPSDLAKAAAGCAYDATMTRSENMRRVLSVPTLPYSKRTGTLVLLVRPPEPVKPEAFVKQQQSEIQEFFELEFTQSITERIRAKYEWLHPDYFPTAEKMRELIFGRDLSFALRGMAP